MHKTELELSQKIKKLLIDEKEILLAGRFESLEGLLEKKQLLFDEFSSLITPPSPSILRKLETLLAHNQCLYEASQRGLAAGKTHIEEILQVVDSLKTYSDEGIVKSEDTSPPKHSVKA